MSIDRLPFGSHARVSGVRSGHALAHRLMELGCVSGADIELVRRAPFGGPLHVRVGGTDLVLRASDASLIIVTDS